MLKSLRHFNSERTIRQSYGEWEPADAAKIRLSHLPSGEYDGKSIVDDLSLIKERKLSMMRQVLVIRQKKLTGKLILQHLFTQQSKS